MQSESTPKQVVLVVDDEPALRKLVTELLRDKGYEVLTAADGNSALKVARKYKGEINLMITDVMMPNLDGFDLRERILQERPALRILVMSGALDPEIVGADFPIIRKPFSNTTLVSKIREVLNESRKAAPTRAG